MQQSSDMVERIARILRKSREINCSWDDAERLARSVLEASHHAEIVEALRAFVHGDNGDDIDSRYENAREVLARLEPRS
jgi:hypothetical protein